MLIVLASIEPGTSGALAELLAKVGCAWLIGVAAVGLLRRASAATREGLLRATGWVALALPAAMLVAPRWGLPASTAPIRPAAAPLPALLAPPEGSRPVEGPLAQPHARRTPSLGAVPPDAVPGGASALGRALVAAWALGAVVVLWPALAGLGALRRFRRRAAPVADARALALLGELRSALVPGRAIDLVQDESLVVPLAWDGAPRGRALVALPGAASAWPVERLRSALAHELAHVERRDGWAGLAARLALALSWPWPHAWWAWRRQLALAEQACDDRVLSLGARASSYAEHLVALAPRAARRWTPATSMVRGGALEERVRALLDGERARGAFGARARRGATLGSVVVLAGLAGLGRAAPASQDAPAAPAPGGALARGAAEAVERGLRALLALQREDGSWSGSLGYKLNTAYRETALDVPHVGVTALALDALLAAGARPGEGERGRALERGLAFLVACAKVDPGYVQHGGSRMPSHALACALLARAWRATGDEALREVAQSAVDFTLRAKIGGGWRYIPFATESDLLNTVDQVRALQAARDVGLAVPQAALDGALAHVLEHHSLADGPFARGFAYQSLVRGGVARVTVATTAAGLLALAGEGRLEREVSEPLLAALPEQLATATAKLGDSALGWASRELVASALHAWAAEAGGPEGEADLRRWSSFEEQLAGELLELQHADGTWPCQGGPGPAFATAVACRLLLL